MTILLYGCTSWTLTKRIENKLDGNCTRILQAILNKSWKKHLTKQLLYGHLAPISKTLQVIRTRYLGDTAGEARINSCYVLLLRRVTWKDLIRWYCSETEWTCERWQWRNALHSPKLQHHWNLTTRLFSVISRILVWGVLTTLQRCSQIILQPRPTGQKILFFPKK